MKCLIFSVCLVLMFVGQVKSQRKVGPMHNNVDPCKADTTNMIRRGLYLREKGRCQQGYICDGEKIVPFRRPCPEPSYMSVHTGTCSMPNIYTYVYGTFNCSAEDNDPNLNYELLNEKRLRACESLMSRPEDEELYELYAGDPDDCRRMFKCPMTAAHDDWLFKCPDGFRFQSDGPGDVYPCVPDEDDCFGNGRGK